MKCKKCRTTIQPPEVIGEPFGRIVIGGWYGGIEKGDNGPYCLGCIRNILYQRSKESAKE